MTKKPTPERTEQGGVSVAREPSLGEQLKAKQEQFQAALPSHIKPERFVRVVATAVQNNPDLWRADRQSFWLACVKAAQDGLMPDNHEGALVIYSTNVKGEWIKKVQWMPMIAGLRKKAHNSGEIATWDVQAVHAKDAFEFELGDDPFIKHAPSIDADRGELIAVYSVATLKSGHKSRDVMSVAEVLAVRNEYAKKDRDGNYSPAWRKSFDEMAKKTIARRHAKVLPMSTDLEALLHRDDDLYEVNPAPAVERRGPPLRSLSDKLDALAGVAPEKEPAAGQRRGEAQATGVDGGPKEDGDSGPPQAEDKYPDSEEADDERRVDDGRQSGPDQQ